MCLEIRFCKRGQGCVDSAVQGPGLLYQISSCHFPSGTGRKLFPKWSLGTVPGKDSPRRGVLNTSQRSSCSAPGIWCSLKRTFLASGGRWRQGLSLLLSLTPGSEASLGRSGVSGPLGAS